MTDPPPIPDDFPAETWILVRALPSETPAAVRFRHLLKRMLRDHGLKAVRVSGVGPGPEVEQTGPADAESRGTSTGHNGG
jgi:hypothetical protein